ncbi:MAG: long-chain fatty acid--CoA ligase [Deltaproteobacteria bacterium]|nr:long-chain fatty acid--CoA ligase [Deltaproteobacteria bacterium]
MTDSPRSVPALFLERVGKTPGAEAFRAPDGAGWKSLTWRETEERVRAMACGLAALGLQPEQRCAILSSTRLEWLLADFGILCAGGATTTIYPSSTAEECAFILSDSGSVFCFAENDEQVGKLQSRRAEMPALRQVVVIEGRPSADGWVITLADLEARGRAHDAARPGGFEETAEAVKRDDLATLIYTSGTTGKPKGVELTHGCWVSQSAAVEASGILSHPEPYQFFWLPLAHSFGKMIGTAQLRIGFPTAVDGRIEKIVENLGAVRPTFVCAVPRIFEKVYAKVLQNAREGGAVKQVIFRRAVEVGIEAARLEREGRTPGPLLAAQRALFDRLVFQKVRALFGGRLRFFISGSAPLAREIHEFFAAVGVPVLEGYGLTESSAATHVNLPGKARLGTVGPALQGTEVKLAEDGEVLMRGPWIMRGYHGLPAASAEALDAEGWLHTGDIGQVDAQGYLAITDRKKDLIKTSGGKYVAPQELEGKLKAACTYVSQVVVHGDRRNYVSALITLDPLALRSWATAAGMGGLPHEELVKQPQVKALVQEAVTRMNADLPKYATLKKFTLLPREFSEAEGEVTPSQKLRRKVIETRYRAALDAMYGGANGV